MATVKLTDVIDVEIYSAIEPEDTPEKSAFFDSGVVVQTAAMNSIATAEAELVKMPFWRDLDMDLEPNYSDDSDNASAPHKIVQARMDAKRVALNQSWSARDLTNEVTMGVEPMTRVRNRTGRYWKAVFQRRLVQTAMGVYNNNIRAANAGMDAGFGVTGDMVYDISIDNGVGATANFFSRLAFTTARFTLGDSYNELSAILCHSTVYQQMVDQDDIDFIADSQQSGAIALYQGHRVIVDDMAPTVATTTGGGIRYFTILFGKAAFAYGAGTPTTPVEIDRNPAIGNGSGEETLYERKSWILHPFGHSNTNVINTHGETTGGAGDGLWQTLTDCAAPTNWKRNYFRKNVPLAFLVTNG